MCGCSWRSALGFCQQIRFGTDYTQCVVQLGCSPLRASACSMWQAMTLHCCALSTAPAGTITGPASTSTTGGGSSGSSTTGGNSSGNSSSSAEHAFPQVLTYSPLLPCCHCPSPFLPKPICALLPSPLFPHTQWCGPACGSPRGLHSHRYHRTLQAHERLQRPTPHGLGRIWPACRAVCNPDRHSPCRHNAEEHRQVQGAAQDAGIQLRLAAGGVDHRP